MQKLTNNELGRPTLSTYHQLEKLPLILVLDNVRSALNVGSSFRTADAFRIEAIYLCGITATPPNKEILKTALGATDSVKWVYFEDTLEAVQQLKSNQYAVIAIEQTQNSTMLNKANFIAQKTAVVLGHEMDGVQQSVINSCDYCIEIPQEGTKHSLNVSVCAGILCWEYYRQNLTPQ